MSTTHNNLRPQIEAPVKRDQAEVQVQMILTFRNQQLSRALARRNGCRDDGERMMAQMDVDTCAAHLRTAIESCRVLKVRQGFLAWQPSVNIQQLLEKVGRA